MPAQVLENIRQSTGNRPLQNTWRCRIILPYTLHSTQSARAIFCLDHQASENLLLSLNQKGIEHQPSPVLIRRISRTLKGQKSQTGALTAATLNLTHGGVRVRRPAPLSRIAAPLEIFRQMVTFRSREVSLRKRDTACSVALTLVKIPRVSTHM